MISEIPNSKENGEGGGGEGGKRVARKFMQEISNLGLLTASVAHSWVRGLLQSLSAMPSKCAAHFRLYSHVPVSKVYPHA